MYTNRLGFSSCISCIHVLYCMVNWAQTNFMRYLSTASLLADVSAKDSDNSRLRAELDSLQKQLAGMQDMLKGKEVQMSNLKDMMEQTKVNSTIV